MAESLTTRTSEPLSKHPIAHKADPAFVDCHTHTVYSGHGEGSVREVVQAAVDKGASTVALTEHLILPEGIDPAFEFSMSEEQSIRYHEDVLAARELFPQVEVLYGAEADWLGTEDFLLAHATGYDYLLGSVHFIDGFAFDDPACIDGWRTRDTDEVWIRYFEIWCDAVSSAVPFTCMSHPDLVKKFGFMPSFDPRELYAHAAEVAAKAGVMVEVNTAGKRKPVGEYYPGIDLLKAFFEAGVDCTVGSDAHSPSEVGFEIPQALLWMQRAGYRRLTVPSIGGDRRYVDLDNLDTRTSGTFSTRL